MTQLLEALGDARAIQSGLATALRCGTNEVIVRKGERDRHLYLIESGRVRVYARVGIDGERHIQPGLVDLGPGAVFGEFNLFESAPRSASVVAIEDSVLLQIDGSRLDTFFQMHPDLGLIVLRDLYQILIQRLRKADERIEGLFAWGLRAHGIEQHLKEA